MIYTIYKVTCADGRVYVGMTRASLRRRWSEHCRTAMRGSRYAFHTALRALGQSAFEMEAIDLAHDLQSAMALEKQYIASLGSKAPAGFNSTIGGQGTGGAIYTPERRAALSRAHRGRVFSLATRHRLSESMRQRMSDPAVRAQLSRARTGFRMAEDVKQKISAAMITRGPIPKKLSFAIADRIREQLLCGAARKDLRRQHDISPAMLSMIATRRCWT